MISSIHQTDVDQDINKSPVEILASMYEMAQICHFFILFRQVLHLPEFSRTDLENAIIFYDSNQLIQDQFLPELHFRLCRDAGGNNPDKIITEWERSLNVKIAQHYKKVGFEINPLKDTKYNDLTIRQKVLILKCLCDWRLESISVHDAAKYPKQNLLINPRPVGMDDKSHWYWYFGDECWVYKEEIDPTTKKDEYYDFFKQENIIKDNKSNKKASSTINEMDIINKNSNNNNVKDSTFSNKTIRFISKKDANDIIKIKTNEIFIIDDDSDDDEDDDIIKDNNFKNKNNNNVSNDSASNSENKYKTSSKEKIKSNNIKDNIKEVNSDLTIHPIHQQNQKNKVINKNNNNSKLTNKNILNKLNDIQNKKPNNSNNNHNHNNTNNIMEELNKLKTLTCNACQKIFEIKDIEPPLKTMPNKDEWACFRCLVNGARGWPVRQNTSIKTKSNDTHNDKKYHKTPTNPILRRTYEEDKLKSNKNKNNKNKTIQIKKTKCLKKIQSNNNNTTIHLKNKNQVNQISNKTSIPRNIRKKMVKYYSSENDSDNHNNMDKIIHLYNRDKNEYKISLQNNIKRLEEMLQNIRNNKTIDNKTIDTESKINHINYIQPSPPLPPKNWKVASRCITSMENLILSLENGSNIQERLRKKLIDILNKSREIYLDNEKKRQQKLFINAPILPRRQSSRLAMNKIHDQLTYHNDMNIDTSMNMNNGNEMNYMNDKDKTNNLSPTRDRALRAVRRANAAAISNHDNSNNNMKQHPELIDWFQWDQLHTHSNPSRQVGLAIIDRLLREPISTPFAQPVDPVLDGCPTYFQIIKEPMDLRTVKTKIIRDKFKKWSLFEYDMNLIWNNCNYFNHSDSFIVSYSNKLKELYDCMNNEAKEYLKETIKQEELNNKSFHSNKLTTSSLSSSFSASSSSSSSSSTSPSCSSDSDSNTLEESPIKLNNRKKRLRDNNNNNMIFDKNNNNKSLDNLPVPPRKRLRTGNHIIKTNRLNDLNLLENNENENTIDLNQSSRIDVSNYAKTSLPSIPNIDYLPSSPESSSSTTSSSSSYTSISLNDNESTYISSGEDDL